MESRIMGNGGPRAGARRTSRFCPPLQNYGSPGRASAAVGFALRGDGRWPITGAFYAMKIVLAYSGGLDTSVIVKWLKETYAAEIVTFAADIGQGEELRGLARKALRTGASRHFTLDLVEEFARDFIYPMLRANAVYEGQYHLGT